jgi:glycosyltransferase involved in cell wall biosynthesis
MIQEHSGSAAHLRSTDSENRDKSTDKQGNDPIRVLIISYHFPPLNVIASFRAEGFAQYLPDHGMEVTVLTMLWEKDPSGGMAWHPKATAVSEHLEGKANVIRIPRIKTLAQRVLDNGLHVPLVSAAIAFCSHALGHFNLALTYSDLAFKKFLRQHLKTHCYDVVIVTSPPEDHIALGAWIKKHHDIAFIADYRDLYDLRALGQGTGSSISERIILSFKHTYHRRWMKHCDLAVSVSRPLIDTLATYIAAQRTLEIRNGYHAHKISADQHSIPKDKFKVTYAGRIYPWQDVGPFIQAYKAFTAKLTPEEVKLTDLKFFGSQDPQQIERLKSAAFASSLEIHPQRIPADAMYQHIGESSVLLVFDIGLLGGYTGKLMDYLGCHRNVLLIPSDNGVMAELVHTSGIGLATSDPVKACDQLLAWFRQWQVHGRPDFHGDERVIDQGSRAAQTALLAEAITTLVKKPMAYNA